MNVYLGGCDLVSLMPLLEYAALNVILNISYYIVWRISAVVSSKLSLLLWYHGSTPVILV